MRVPFLTVVPFLIALGVTSSACTVASQGSSDDVTTESSAAQAVRAMDVGSMGEAVSSVPSADGGRSLQVKQWRFFQRNSGSQIAIRGYDGVDSTAKPIAEVAIVGRDRHHAVRISVPDGSVAPSHTVLVRAITDDLSVHFKHTDIRAEGTKSKQAACGVAVEGLILSVLETEVIEAFTKNAHQSGDEKTYRAGKGVLQKIIVTEAKSDLLATEACPA
ncbi:MAG: hypothetical protein NVS3B20_26020 [Polyangiales bacterium]